MKKLPKNKPGTVPEKPEPIRHREEVRTNPDPKIDEDFPGYPHAPSQEKQINPKNLQEELESGILKKPVKPPENRE